MLTTLLIIIGTLLFILLWLLFAPFQLKIDSQKRMVEFQWKTIGKGALILSDEDLLLETRLFFWKKVWHPLTWKFKSEKKKKKPKKAKGKSFLKLKWKKIKNLLRSFKVRILKIDLDTDDYIVNSYLYPVFYFLNNPAKHRSMRVNYEGRFYCFIVIENSGWRILKALI